MNLRLLAAPLILLASTALAADRPEVPSEPIARKTEILFQDDFNDRTDLGDQWKVAIPTFTIEDDALKGRQTRQADVPASDGKPAAKAHQAVIGLDHLPNQDTIVELRFKFAGANGLSVQYDDKKYTGSHAGHICVCRVTPKGVLVADRKEGSMRNDIFAMTDPAQKAERATLLKGRDATFPLALDKPEDWHSLTVEVAGDQMRASVDGKPVAYLKSPGIAHATKSRIAFCCQGKGDGFFDDVKVWNAAPVK